MNFFFKVLAKLGNYKYNKDINDYLKELDKEQTLDDMKLKSTKGFKRIVKIRTKEYTIDYLLDLKMDNLNNPKIKLQNYLKDSKIPV